MASTAVQARTGAQLAQYGTGTSPAQLCSHIISALEPHVLQPAAETLELRGYFETVAYKIESIASIEDDGVSGTPAEVIEQTALLFCQHDADGDGLLSPEEFGRLIELISSQTGESYLPEHVERVFRQCDIDANGFIDFNELLLLPRPPTRPK